MEQFRLADGDCLVLCTNGLTDALSDDDIADTLAARRTAQEHCEELVDAALASGGQDDVTLVVANYHVPESANDVS